MAQRSHVPKFGNWEGDNVPYTAYFENARKEKIGGVRINPNDPEQNPEAFNVGGVSPDRQVAPRRFGNQRSIYERDSRKIMASESSSPSDSSGTPVNRPNLQHKKSDKNKYNTASHVPPSPGPYSMNQPDDFSYRSVSVPKFGQWDEKDPRSAEGFTVIFNKVKEEKQIAATKFPPVPLHNNYQTSPEKETRKKFCCLF